MFTGPLPAYFQVLCTVVVVLFTALWLALPLSALYVFLKQVFLKPSSG